MMGQVTTACEWPPSANLNVAVRDIRCGEEEGAKVAEGLVFSSEIIEANGARPVHGVVIAFAVVDDIEVGSRAVAREATTGVPDDSADPGGVPHDRQAGHLDVPGRAEVFAIDVGVSRHGTVGTLLRAERQDPPLAVRQRPDAMRAPRRRCHDAAYRRGRWT